MSDELSRDDLRHTLLAQRATLFGPCHKNSSGRLSGHLRLALEQRYGPLNSLNVGAYLPIGSEPDVTSLFSSFKSVALPKVVGHDLPLIFLRYQEGMALTRQALGVQVPLDAEEVRPELLIVPCLGFHVRADRRIDRIGYGGGFYDRTLAAQPCASIGVAFAVCEVENFEAGDHDQPLDGIVTEEQALLS
jgi:5-formyltetrahydrofolate cyclo-ligase